MASIKKWDRQVSPLQPHMPQVPNALVNGNALQSIAKGFQKLGDGMDDYTKALQKRQDDDDKFALTEAKTSFLEQADGVEENLLALQGRDALGTRGKAEAELMKLAGKQRIDSPKVRDEFMLWARQQAVVYEARARDHRTRERTKWREGVVRGTEDTSFNRATAHWADDNVYAESLGTALQAADQLAEAQGLDPSAERTRIKQRFITGRIASALVGGDGGLVLAEKLIDQHAVNLGEKYPHFVQILKKQQATARVDAAYDSAKDFYSEDQARVFIEGLNLDSKEEREAKSAIGVEFSARRASEERRKKEYADRTQEEFLARSLRGELTVPMVRSSKLTVAQQRTWLKALKEGGKATTDPDVYASLYAGIQRGDDISYDDLARHVGDGLSLSDMKGLFGAVTKAREAREKDGGLAFDYTKNATYLFKNMVKEGYLDANDGVALEALFYQLVNAAGMEGPEVHNLARELLGKHIVAKGFLWDDKDTGFRMFRFPGIKTDEMDDDERMPPKVYAEIRRQLIAAGRRHDLQTIYQVWKTAMQAREEAQ